MKKVFGFMAVLFGALVLVGCKGNNKDLNVAEQKNVYALSTLASVDGIINQPMVSPRTLNLDEMIDEVKKVESNHQSLIDGVLNGDSPMKVEEELLVDQEFEKLITITLEINEETVIYQLYLNEELLKEERDEEETEIEYVVSGKLIIDEKEYVVSGKKEIEKDGSEEEFEIELKISLDENNYSIVKYEDEVDTEDKEVEKEFKQEIYQNGQLVSSSKFDYELENDEMTLKIVIINQDGEKEYKFINENNSNETIVKINGKAVVKIIVNEQGEKEYVSLETENLVEPRA